MRTRHWDAYGSASMLFFDGAPIPAIASVVSGVLLFLSIANALDTSLDAINATMAPEAYAIDAVLGKLRG